MLNFNEEQIKIVSDASKNASKKELNLYCAYYPSSGNIDITFGAKTRHFPGKDYKPNGIAVALDVIDHPVEPEEIRAMIESAVMPAQAAVCSYPPGFKGKAVKCRPARRVKSGKYKDWRKPKGEKEMEKYEVFASEGGYRVALGIWGGNPIIDQSPWFKTREEAEEKARDAFFDDNARNIEVCEPYENEFCVRLGSEFFDAENQEAAKEMAIREIEKRGFSREYILKKRKDLQ